MCFFPSLTQRYVQAFRVSKSGLDPMRSSPAVLLCYRFFLRLFQYWLGGSPENVESLLLTLAKSYVPEVREMDSVVEQDIAEPVLLPDKGIWHPVADKVFENADEYLAWYNQVHTPPSSLCEGFARCRGSDVETVASTYCLSSCFGV